MDEIPRFGSASLTQVAKLLNRTEEEVLEDAISAAGESAAHRGWLGAEAVAALLSNRTPERALAEAEPLLLAAFRQAQETSKTDWTSMAVPVLKNRLLQLSSNSFNELEFGSPNIWHFVTLFPELLATDGARPRERVRLLTPNILDVDHEDIPVSLDRDAKGRIRVDLWRAIFDYRSKDVFVWDEALGRARVRSNHDSKELPVIPTLSPDDLTQQRQEFVSVQEKVTEHDAARLELWSTRGGGTAALPRSYRGLWNTHLKSHAANTLRAFFLSHGLEVPADLVTQAALPVDSENDVERTRRMAHRYVDAMTGDELARLSIELAVVSRVPLSFSN